MRFVSLLTLAFTLMLGGCAATVKGVGEDFRALTAPQQSPQATAPQTAHVDCEKALQPGCEELRVLSFYWDPQSAALRNLDRPYTSQEERQDRAQFLGPRLWEEYRKGNLRAAAPRSFTIMMWNVTPVPITNLSAYRVNTNKNVMRKVSVEEITGAKIPVFDTSVTNLGPPQRVFRVRTEGVDAVGASVQFPWSLITDRTYILVCAEDGPVVYPPGKDAGLWVSPETLRWLKDKGSRRVLLPFILPN